LPDRLWVVMEPSLPPAAPQPKGGRPPAPARRAMEAIWFVMRTGCPWRALNATTLCSSATAERRFREWKRAGVFERLHRASLDGAHAAGAVDRGFLAVDGCHVKAPLSRTEKGGRRGSTGASRARSGRPSSTAAGSSCPSPWPAATATTCRRPARRWPRSACPPAPAPACSRPTAPSTTRPSARA
jgi:transposase